METKARNTIGIDAGGTLIKIAYEENGRLHFKKYPVGELNACMDWLALFAAGKRVVLTGGKAGMIKSNHFPDAEMADEFHSSCEGARFLLKQNHFFEERFLLVNVGTGTSWFLIEDDRYERILGSGVGGGMFMGLGSLLGEAKDFNELVELAKKGTRGNVDLLVKDIYAPLEPPIPGDLTASNFAKANDANTQSDRVAAVSNLIAETLTLLTVQASVLHKTTAAVFIGSTVAGNGLLQEELSHYLRMSDIKPIFLENGEFSGAIGAKMF